MQQIQFVRRLLHILCRDNAELFYKDDSPHCIGFLFCFVSKSKMVKSVDMTVWIAHICQIFAESSQFLQVQIPAIYFASDQENADWKTFSIPLRFCFVPPLRSSPFHIHPVLFILYFIIMKSHLIISPSYSYSFIHHIILALCIRSCILRASYLFRDWE